MFNIEKAFKKLLEPVLDIPVIVKYTPIDYTPCLTIQQVDERFLKRVYVEINNQQCIRKKYASDLWINIWANNEKERHLLIKKIKDRILQAESNHYSTCNNYKETECAALNRECEALTSNTNRANKGQCPNTKIYNSFFKTNNIIKNSFRINSVTNLDELDLGEPVLRTIFKLEMDYYQYWTIGGRVFNKIELNEDLL